MGFSIPLKRIGAHALEQIERAAALASDAAPGAPGVGPRVKLRAAEISIAFAIADGSRAPPETVVSDAPLPTEELRKLLEPLDTPVRVALTEVKQAPRSSVGRLVLRVIF